MPELTVKNTYAVFAAAHTIASKPRLPRSADAVTPMSVLSHASTDFAAFGDRLVNACRDLAGNAPTREIRVSYEKLGETFTLVPKHARRLAVKFAELSAGFDDLRAITARREAIPPDQAITVDDAGEFQAAVKAIKDISPLPHPFEGARLMRNLAAAMAEFVSFGTKLAGKCRTGAKNAITSAIETEYSSLAFRFTAVRDHAHELHEAFATAAAFFEHLNRTTAKQKA